MTLLETDTVLTVWAAQLKHLIPGFAAGDFLCILAVGMDGIAKCEYRFRYTNTDAFSNDDKINRYGFTAPDDPETRVKTFAALRQMMEMSGFKEVIEVPVNGNFKALQLALMNLPGWGTQMTATDIPASNMPPEEKA